MLQAGGAAITIPATGRSLARQSGVFEGVDTESLLKLCEQHQWVLAVTVAPGSFMLRGSRILSSDKLLPNAVIQELMSYVRISKAESIEGNYFYGFRQLMEVALKALSPGINDPDTAVISLRALFRLYEHRLQMHPQNEFQAGDGDPRLFTTELGFEQIVTETLQPVWDYGKGDRIIRNELRRLLMQALTLHPCPPFTKMLRKVDKAIAGKKRK